MIMKTTILGWLLICGFSSFIAPPARAQTWVEITDVPNYDWYAGCFGTGCGNLMGFWDRNGFADFYTGPTGGGVAPLNNFGANFGIRAMWASMAGMDGRPADKPGHMNDYYVAYESTQADPYVVAGRPEHEPDCIGDFIGLSQRKWTNMNEECDGNIDAYSFVFWDTNGLKRSNYMPTNEAGGPIPDIPSGLRRWSQWRGFDADVFSQLTDFNSQVPAGSGFSFADLKAEINAGYPLLLFLQSFDRNSKSFSGMPKGNPPIHGMLAYGYYDDGLSQLVYYRTSWATDPEFAFHRWESGNWEAFLPIRGVMGFRPKPKITSLQRENGNITVGWDGPSARLLDRNNDTVTDVHRYQVERATSLAPPNFEPVGAQTTARSMTIADCCEGAVFFRVRLVENGEN